MAIRLLTTLLLLAGAPIPFAIGASNWENGDTSGVVLTSSLGRPIIDGVASPGEWFNWSPLSLLLDDHSACNPPPLLNVTVAVMNTAYELSIAVKVPGCLPANETSVPGPPYHSNDFYVQIDDAFVRLINPYNFTLIEYELIVKSLADVRDEARALGSALAFFNDADPSRPSGAAGFQPNSSQSKRGTYTFEMSFPFTTTAPVRDANDRLLYMGLRPAPRYHLWLIGFGERGDDGHSYSFSYRYPAYGVPETEWLYVAAAFDPMPGILLVTGIVTLVVVITVFLAIVRYRRSKREAVSD